MSRVAKSLAAVAAACSALLLAGCVPSLQPFYQPDQVGFDPTLLGLWQDEEQETWRFEKAGVNAYKVTYTDEEGKTGTFDGHLFSVGSAAFLDLLPVEPALYENGFYKFHLVPVHTCLRIYVAKPTLKVGLINPVWFDRIVENDPSALRHETTTDDYILVTAQTGELQAFLLKHLETAEAFSLLDLTRVEEQR